MRQYTKRIIGCLLALGLSSVALAETKTNFNISWWTTSAGGGTSNGGNYTLSGTAGQSGVTLLAGNSFTLEGGFWVVDETTSQRVYLPLIER